MPHTTLAFRTDDGTVYLLEPTQQSQYTDKLSTNKYVFSGFVLPPLPGPPGLAPQHDHVFRVVSYALLGPP